jgi:L-asparaginase
LWAGAFSRTVLDMIAILFTGGTMSMRLDPKTGAAVPALSGGEILEHVPGLKAIAEIDFEDVSRLPGPHVTPEQMWRLARRAAAWLERPDVDGLVITHGTDTLEETAYLLDLLLLSSKPVVIVGAIRTISEAGWDGPANLLAAVRVAAAPGSRERGVMVVMNEQILTASEAQKIHTESAGSFASPEFGPVGVIDAGKVLYVRMAPRHGKWTAADADAGLRVSRLETNVDLIKSAAGADDRFLRSSLASGAKGIVIEAMGRGNLPPTMKPGIVEAERAAVPVVISSRYGAGSVQERYGYEGGGHDLAQLGVIFAGRLNGLKARMKLMVALGYTNEPAVLREIFAETASE